MARVKVMHALDMFLKIMMPDSSCEFGVRGMTHSIPHLRKNSLLEGIAAMPFWHPGVDDQFGAPLRLAESAF